MAKILLADDDDTIVDTTTYALRREGFSVVVAGDGNRALQQWSSGQPDLVLLDIRLPGMNGLDVCQQIRQKSDTPVIMLSGLDDDRNIIEGFQRGADDYIIKPYTLRQLVMRIRAVMRRSSDRAPEPPHKMVKVGRWVLDLEAHDLADGSTRVYLTPHEFRILAKLALNRRQVVKHRDLVEYTWGYDVAHAGMLKPHISRLRKKMNLAKGEDGYIEAVARLGYTLKSSCP